MKRNFLFTAISVGSRLLVGLLLFLLLARLWGPELFGTFAFVFSVCALLTLLVDFGFAVFLLREVAAAPEQAGPLVAASLRAKLALCAVLLLAAIAVAALLGPKLLPPGLFLVLLLATVLMSFADFFIAPLRALGRYDLETGVVTVSNTLLFLLAGGVAWAGGGVMAVAGAMVAARCLFALAAWATLRRVLPAAPWRAGGVAVRPLLQRIWPYGLDGMLTTAWSQLDVVAVRLFFGVQAAGLYAAGQKVVLGVSALAPIVGNVMIPRLSRQCALRHLGFWRTSAKTGGLMTVIGVSLAAPLFLFPIQVTSLLFGTSYFELSTMLPWFGVLIFVRYLGAGFGVVLTSAGLQRKRMIGQVCGLAVFCALTFVLAPCLEGPIAVLLAAVSGVLVVIASNAYFLAAARRDGLGRAA